MKWSPPINCRRQSFRWGAGVALVAAAPKCLLCAWAYLGLGAALGLTGPELCGGASSAFPGWLFPAWAAGVLAVAALRLRKLSD